MNTMNLLEYVVAKLKENTGNWPAISEQTGVPYHTITKIAYKKTKDPGVTKIQTLADYFRSIDKGEAA